MRTIKQRIRTAAIKRKVIKKLDIAYKALGSIDKLHESGRITKRQHDSKSRAVLKRLVRK